MPRKGYQRKPCKTCGSTEPRGQGSTYCLECSSDCSKHPEGMRSCPICYRLWANRAKKKSRYGLTEVQLKALESISGCEVCGSEKKLVIDHNHETGKVRGILCDLCNKGLGHLREDPDILISLIHYIKERN